MSGTSAEQFALMGAVFLLLGAAFVFAPQIVSAVNGFLARLFRPRRRPERTSASPPAPATEEAPPVRRRWADPPAVEASRHQTAPAPPASTTSPSSDVVARLLKEIDNSWKDAS